MITGSALDSLENEALQVLNNTPKCVLHIEAKQK